MPARTLHEGNMLAGVQCAVETTDAVKPEPSVQRMLSTDSCGLSRVLCTNTGRQAGSEKWLLPSLTSSNYRVTVISTLAPMCVRPCPQRSHVACPGATVTIDRTPCFLHHWLFPTGRGWDHSRLGTRHGECCALLYFEV